jgi:ATP/maltotriose-dependent transcriptional regulator MalT
MRNWERYHQLVTTSISRRLTTKEELEYLQLETFASNSDAKEWEDGREALRHARVAHEGSMSSVEMLADTIARWLDINEVPKM